MIRKPALQGYVNEAGIADGLASSYLDITGVQSGWVPTWNGSHWVAEAAPNPFNQSLNTTDSPTFEDLLLNATPSNPYTSYIASAKGSSALNFASGSIIQWGPGSDAHALFPDVALARVGSYAMALQNALGGYSTLDLATLTAHTSVVSPSLTLNGTTLNSAATNSVPGYLTAADHTTFAAKQAAGNYLTALTGDGTASGPGSAVLTLAMVNSNVGAFTSANITVDAKGRITAAANGSGGGGSPGGSSDDIQVNGSGSFVGGRGTLDSSGNLAVSGNVFTQSQIQIHSGIATWKIGTGSESPIPFLYVGGGSLTSNYFWRANWSDPAFPTNTFRNPNASDLVIADFRAASGQTFDCLHVSSVSGNGDLLKISASGGATFGGNVSLGSNGITGSSGTFGNGTDGVTLNYGGLVLQGAAQINIATNPGGTPSNTITPTAWYPVTIGMGSYFWPLFQ